MRENRRQLTRADLPGEFTPETIRTLPISTLKRLARPGNGVLSPAEQPEFDAALHQMMSEAARRVSRQVGRPDWAAALRQAAETQGSRGPRRDTRADQSLRRLASRIGQQVDLAEGLAPGVDWSFAQPGELSASTSDDAGQTPTAESEDADTGTVDDLEQRLSEQVELVQVMSEIAEVSKRTYALEQQRDLQSIRGLFFGFVVSVTVIVAGWAPIVAADDWAQRGWILGLTVATVVVAGLVYALVRRYQNAHPPAGDS